MPELPAHSDPQVNPAAVPVDALARLLGLPMGHLRRHLDEGAPTNRDGTINLIHYAAWLNTNPRNLPTPGTGAGTESGGTAGREPDARDEPDETQEVVD